MNDNVKLWNDEQHRTRNAELVNQILQSDDKEVIDRATTEFYTLNSQLICNFILKKLGNAGNWCDAEELTNDTFQRTFAYLHTVREPKKILNWMFKVAEQIAAGWHRKNKKRLQLQSFAEVSEFDMNDAAIRAYQETQDRQMKEIRQEKLEQAIEQLPELERRICYMLLEGKSYEEIYIALRVDFPLLKPSSIRSRASRMRGKLRAWEKKREELDAEGYDLEFSEFMEN